MGNAIAHYYEYKNGHYKVKSFNIKISHEDIYINNEKADSGFKKFIGNISIGVSDNFHGVSVNISGIKATEMFDKIHYKYLNPTYYF